MKIKVFYQDRCKFNFEDDLANIYKRRIMQIPKKIISDFLCVRISLKQLNHHIQKEKKKSFIVLLDENGKSFSSIDFNKKIMINTNNSISFFIGSTDGFSSEILSYANIILSLSKMTLTHSFTLIILLEQIYRSATIKLNHPYHRK